MKIAFILFGHDPQLRKHFSVSGAAMVPKEIRDKHGSSYKFFTQPPHLAPVEYCLKVNSENPEFAVVLIAQLGFQSDLMHLGLPTSVLDTSKKGFALELSRVLTFWIKRLNAINNLFEPMGNRKALLLPFSNFDDQIVQVLWTSINMNLSARSFGLAVEIERLIAHLRTKEFPKRKNGSKADKYFIDERGYHFQYGPEEHSHPVTEGYEHTDLCAINSRIRFGMPFSSRKHYNLSLDGNGNLKGHQFTDCHGSGRVAESCDHLNIFPNSFIN